MQLSEKELIDIRTRCDAARPGPWLFERNSVIKGAFIAENCLTVRTADNRELAYITEGLTSPAQADATFVASARRDVERLALEILRLRIASVCLGFAMPQDLPTSRVKAIFDRSQNTRPGPWIFRPNDTLGNKTIRGVCRVIWAGCQDVVYITPFGQDDGNADALFIASARGDITCLLDEIFRLRIQLTTSGMDPDNIPEDLQVGHRPSSSPVKTIPTT
jgi:hypothetical protein